VPLLPDAAGRPFRRVAVLVDTSTTWGRDLVTGIQNYARTHGPWQTFLEPRGIEERIQVPRGWRGHGVVARVGRPEMVRDLKALGIPVVNVSGIHLPGADFPRVVSDLTASGGLAARYFLERGYRSFAYFSLVGLRYVATHREAFASALRKAGHGCAVFAVRPRRGAETDWNIDLTRLGAWLTGLPRPVAALTWNAGSSRQVLYACQAAGLLVPEDVAILSGTDDRLMCEFSHIPLSGVQVAARQIGQRAAELLDRLMQGAAAPRTDLLVPPLGVTTRQSTDTLAIPDPVLVKAMSFIRASAPQAFRVADVARHAGVSRRLLELKFREKLGRAPAEEIRRAHFERAKELLATTDLPIPDVAQASGFGSPEYLAAVFATRLRTTPLRYRRTVRLR
jgi:LacI family transcriptional regulator